MPKIGDSIPPIGPGSNKPHKSDKDKEGNLEGRSVKKLTTEERGAAVVAAASSGALNAIKELLSEGQTISDSYRGKAVLKAIEGWHFHIVQQLLSEGQTIPDYARGEAVIAAAERGHFGIVRHLLKGGEAISDSNRGRAAYAALKSGHTAIVRYLWPKVHMISGNDRIPAVIAAVKSGSLDMVQYLLPKRQMIPQDTLEEVVIEAAARGFFDLVQFLLQQGQEISKFTREKAVFAASENGHLGIVEFLLLSKQSISKSYRGLAVGAASENGHLGIVEFLLRDGQTISDHYRGLAVGAASKNGHLGIVEFLLRDGQTISDIHLYQAIVKAAVEGYTSIIERLLDGHTISQYTRGQAVVEAAVHGHADSIEVLLMNGPISITFRNRALIEASGSERDSIINLLDSAPLLESTELKDGFSVTFANIREKPKYYLQQLAENGLPRRVHLKDNPEAVDLGGLTKQFLTVLINACCDKKVLKVTESRMPTIVSKADEKALYNLGRFYVKMEERNESRTDKFLIGELFNPNFYQLVKNVVKGGSNETLLQQTAYIISKVDKALKIAADVVLQPTNVNIAKSYKEAMALEGDVSSLENAKEYIKPYLEAAQAFCTGLDERIKAQFSDKTSEDICIKFQGEACTKEALLGALNVDASDAEDVNFNKKFEWIKEKIQSSDLEWRQRFVYSVTGNKSLALEAKIWIRKRQDSPAFEIHTCFNSLDLPAVEMEKETFLAGFEIAIDSDGYNIE